MIEPHDFFIALMDKFKKVAKEKDRSLTPWLDYDKEFLRERLIEERMELDKAWLDWAIGETPSPDGVQDELIDVAAFCCFLYLRLEKEKNE